MPYSKISDLPATFGKLPDGAKEIAMNVINSALGRGADEESAMKQAWGAIKKSYEQDAGGNWTKIEKDGELETVNLDSVEILGVGTWVGSGGPKTYKRKDLDEIVKAYKTLSADDKLNYEPPIKLGHDDGQKLLQKDGFPSAGWVRSLKRVGDKLVASLGEVPKKIGDIIRAGGYKKVSSEIYHDYTIGGNQYPLVLKAVALLGGDIPAVKTIADIQAQYGDDEGYDTVIYEYADGQPDGNPKTDLERVMSHYGVTEEVAKKMLSGTSADDILPPRGTKVNAGEVDLASISSGLDSWLAQAESSIKGKAGSPAIRTFVKEVKARLKELLEKQSKNEEDTLVADQSDTGTHKESESRKEAEMLEELRKLYGLAEDATEAQVLEAVNQSKKTAEAKGQTVSMSEYEDQKGKVQTLQERIDTKERDDRVSRAIRTGKITPAQKEWADKYALADPQGFDNFTEAQPVVVKLSEVGGNLNQEVGELSELEVKVAAQLGNTAEDLLEDKKNELSNVGVS